jgi:hypothetical protein
MPEVPRALRQRPSILLASSEIELGGGPTGRSSALGQKRNTLLHREEAGIRLLTAQRDDRIEQDGGTSDAPKDERDGAEHKGDNARCPQKQIGSVGRPFGYGAQPLGAGVQFFRANDAHAGAADIARRGTGCSRIHQ